MKITDYCPRPAPFDSYIKGKNLIGIEIGVDAGAHAEALLVNNRDIEKLYLVDIWTNPIFFGYTRGRLETKGFVRNIELIAKNSIKASERFENNFFDFIYIDQEHDYDSVMKDLEAWFPKLKSGGLMGYRNYTNKTTPLDNAINDFLKKNSLKSFPEYAEVIIWKE